MFLYALIALEEMLVILTETGAACLEIFNFFLNNIVLALKRQKKCQFFRNFQSFLSYGQITLPINFQGAEE